MKNCSGCGICSACCPQKCITIIENGDGFYEAKIDEKRCSHCGICTRICSFSSIRFYEKEPINGYYYQTNSEYTIKNSSSGGICTDVAIKMFQKSKKVLGVIYDKELHRPKHIRANSTEDILKMCGSKYIQSSISEIERTIRNKESDVCFFGTPCQAYALNSFYELINKRSDISIIDFACHGMPTYFLWERYLNDWVKKNGHEKEVCFRDKSFGWRNYCIKIANQSKETRSSISNGDFFLRSFLSNLCLNKVCYNTCPFHSLKSGADIRVGDSWGNDYYADNRGTSLVISFTENGEKILNDLMDSGKIALSAPKNVFKGQIQGGQKVPKMRNTYIRCLKKNIPTFIINFALLKPYYLVMAMNSYWIRTKKYIKGNKE